jgi:DNA-binding GntR family transcriptional regulator
MTGNASESETRSASRKRFERIHRVLRDRICLLEYGPGSRLGEEELAKEFGTSRTPVRRVLGRLEAEGLVERRHGVGTIVTHFDLDSLEQVYRLRSELASLMGRLAPMNCGERELTSLRAYLSRCEDLARLPDPAEFARLNMDFNLELFSMIGNTPLRDITERLYFQITRIWIRSFSTMDIVDEIAYVGRQISDVIEALKVGDHGAVGDICRAHISMSFERMRRQETPDTAHRHLQTDTHA